MKRINFLFKFLATLLAFLVHDVVYAQSPGGTGTTNLKLWNKANTGVTTSGSNVTGWTDQTATNTFTVTGTPVFQTSALNYNPTILFNGSSRFTGNTAITNITQAFGVGKIASGGGTSGALIGTTTTYAGSSGQYFFHTESNNMFCAGNAVSVYTSFPNGGNAVGYSILGEDLSKTPSTSDVIRLNGTNKTNGSGNDPVVIATATPTIGSRTAVATAQNITTGSEIAEAILYNASLSATDVDKVESYLAIKYGITLAHHYLDAAGSTIFTIGAPYANNIIGIGRDDNAALLQKQSHQADDSTRIYISTLAGSNATNAGSFSSDGQFVLMGHNNDYLFSGSTEYPAGLGIFSRLDREWKITNTSFSGNFSLDIQPKFTGITATDLRVLIDNDGNFTDATLFSPTISFSGGVITVSGISTAMIPANSTRYFTIVSMSTNTTLPVELTSFTAQILKNTSVLLKWQTSTEKNSDYFIIERSADGINWYDIGTVKGSGNTSSSASYSFTDQDPLNDVAWYRLKQTDIDGTISFSVVRSVTINLSLAGSVKLYPNPTVDWVIIEGSKVEMKSIKLFNTAGQDVTRNIILTTLSDNAKKINIGSLPYGLYYIKTQTGFHKLIRK